LNPLAGFQHSGIHGVKTLKSPKEKRAAFDRLKAENAEGVVFKNKDAPYTAGRPASGGPGGVAVCLNGFVRTTEDLDLVVDPSPENIQRLLKQRGIQPRRGRA
jgi:hypothetical protein